MFEFDSRKEAVVVTDESITHAARLADEAVTEKAYPSSETLLSLVALMGTAARGKRSEVELSIDDAKFLHEYADQIITEHQQEDHSLMERVSHVFAGRVAIAQNVLTGTGLVIDAAEKHSDSATEASVVTKSGAPDTSFMDELESLDPISIGVSLSRKQLNDTRNADDDSTGRSTRSPRPIGRTY